MNCTEAAEFIHRMIFEEVQADAGVRQHIDTCSTCNQLYHDALKARKVMVTVRRLEPVLNDPEEFTDSIMSAIDRAPQKTALLVPFLQRLLAAASVAIFLIFGYEQYGVVKKVSTLEMQFSLIKADSCYFDPLRLASTFDINKAGFSFSEVESLINMVKGTTPLTISNNMNLLNKRKAK